MSRVLDAYAKLLAMLGGLMLVTFTIVVSYQVASRYVDAVPRFFWTEEVARFSFIWMLFLGAAVAVHRGTHFTIDLFGDIASPMLKLVMELVVHLAVLLVAALMVFGGSQFVEMGWTRISTTSGIRLAWIYLTIPVCGASMIVFTLQRMRQSWCSFTERRIA